MSFKNFDLKKHPSLMFNKDVAELCASLFKRNNFCIMNFIRVYNDGTVLYLCDNHDWLQKYLSNGYPAIGAFENNKNFQQLKFVLWDSLSDQDPVVVYSRKMFNIRCGITSVVPFDKGYDFFNFGRQSEPSSTLDSLISQQDELNNFTKSFYDKTKKLIEISNHKPLILSKFNEQPLQIESEFYLGPAYGYEHLTAKEIRYLKDLSTGRTVPEIASLYGLSARTIEKHIENVKHKLHCRTQCELGYQIAKLEIDRI